MKSAAELNGEVTELILQAERHDDEGARLWTAVARAEQAIVDSTDPKITELEKEIARSGVKMATHRACWLTRLLLVTKDEGRRHYHCAQCKGTAARNEAYDAFFCSACDIWLEGICSQQGCPSCTGRPDNPSHTQEASG